MAPKVGDTKCCFKHSDWKRECSVFLNIILWANTVISVQCSCEPQQQSGLRKCTRCIYLDSKVQILQLKFIHNVQCLFLRFLKGCRGGALRCQHHFPFYVWYFKLTFTKTQVSVQVCLIIWIRHSLLANKLKINFINRMVQCRPTHSFIHSFSCPLFLSGESRGQQP